MNWMLFVDDDECRVRRALHLSFYSRPSIIIAALLLLADGGQCMNSYRIRLHVCSASSTLMLAAGVCSSPQWNGGVTEIHVSFVKCCGQTGFIYISHFYQSICVRCSFSFFVRSSPLFCRVVECISETERSTMTSCTIFGMRRACNRSTDQIAPAAQW